MKIKTLEHSDVRGKQLWYLDIENDKGTKLLLNVGERTVNAIKQMLEEDETLKRIEENAVKDGLEGKTYQGINRYDQ